MKRIATITLLIMTIVLSGCVNNGETPVDPSDSTDPYEVIQDAIDNTLVSDSVENIVLPSNYGNVSISWSSNIEGTITSTGTLIQSGADQNVTLTAVFSYRSKVLTKLYTTTILGSSAINQTLDDVNSALAQLTFDSFNLTEDETFVSSIDDVNIVWSSDNTTCLSNTGVVTRPGEDDPSCTATVTVTLSKDNVQKTTTFTFKVISMGTTVIYTGYYDSITGLTGSALEDSLHTIINTGFVGVTYGDARYILDETDQDPLNPNNLILVYRQTSINSTWDSGATWNREHVYPQSLLGESADNATVNKASDLHGLKPANPSENSSRGNLPFGTTGGTYEPPDEVKGDIARIVFYMDVMYEDLHISAVGTLSQLLQWNIDDPVDDFERNRNEVIYSYQLNRNPFIDHPELANLIWAN